MWSDGDRVIVADSGNHRVLIYDDFWSSDLSEDPPSADVVIGQSSMTEGPAWDPARDDPCAGSPIADVSGANLRFPISVSSDGQRLLVADILNNRVLVWDAIPTAHGATADLVIGQPDLGSSVSNGGKGSPGAETLSHPAGVHIDGNRVFVADAGNNRVLIWDRIPDDQSGTPATVVVGQKEMSAGSPDAASPGDPMATDSGGGKPSARTLDTPVAVTTLMGTMAVSDYGNNRVLLYHSIPTSNFQPATDEIGHGRFTGDSFAVSRSGLHNPWGVSMSSQGLLVGDFSNNRALEFPLPLRVTEGSVRAEKGPGQLEITVSWEAQPGASGYRVYRDGFWFADINGGAITSFLDSGLSPDSYSYSISALSDNNQLESQSMGTATSLASGNHPDLLAESKPSYRFYLAEGDSVPAGGVASGHGSPPEDLYFEQIWSYLNVANVNSSISGSSCTNVSSQQSLKNRIAGEIAQYEPDLVTLGIGLNDLSLGFPGTHGWVSMSAYRDCLIDVIGMIGPSANRTLLLLNFHHMTNWNKVDPPIFANAPDVASSGSDAKRRAWNKVIRDVAGQSGVSLVDVTGWMDKAIAANPGEPFTLSDNIHPNQAGQDVISDAVLDKLLYPRGNTTDTPMPGRPKTADPQVSPESGAEGVLFEWQPSAGPLQNVSPYELAWSSDQRFIDDVQSSLVETNSKSIKLAPGKWHVRVRAYGVDGGASMWTNWGRVIVDAPEPPPHRFKVQALAGSSPLKEQ